MSQSYRVLFIKVRSKGDHGVTVHPLGIMYLASYLREKFPDIECRILDLKVERMPFRSVVDRIRAFAPHMVGLSCFSNECVEMHRIAALAKAHCRDTLVLAGGPHASAYPRTVLEDPNVDYAVLGEGELTLEDLVTAVRTGGPVDHIDGLAYRKDGTVRVNPRERYIEDLDALPFPAWDLIPIRKYKNVPRGSHTGSADYMSLISSRACPFKCIYCHNIFGKRWRTRSPESFMAEIREIHDKLGIRELEIIDDVFNCDVRRAKRIFDMILESGMKVRFTLPNGLRADLGDEEFFVKARQAGATFMAFAVETASPRLQKLIQKNVNLAKAEQNISYARRQGIVCQGFFMIGFPTETREELQATIDFAVDSDLHAAHFFVVTAYEGTKMAEWARSLGKPVGDHTTRGFLTEEFNNLTDLSDRELDRIRRRGLRRFWLKPSRIVALLRDHPDKGLVPMLAFTFVKRLLVKG